EGSVTAEPSLCLRARSYFVLYNLEVILRSIDGLIDYLARKIAETRELEGLIRGSSRLNHRQLRVVGDALRDPSEPFTIHAQVRRNRVTYQTARTDLLSLESLGLFSKQRVGKKYVFKALPDLGDRLRSLDSAP